MTNSTAGRLVCVNSACSVVGLATTRAQCVRCGVATHAVDEPGLVIPPPRAQPTSSTPKLDTGMEIGSRVFYGGFWALVAVVGGFGGMGLLANGEPAGLLAFIVAALAGIYAVYIFRGGRWRIMFW